MANNSNNTYFIRLLKDFYSCGLDYANARTLIFQIIAYKVLSDRIISKANDYCAKSMAFFNYIQYKDDKAEEEFKSISIKDLGYYIKPTHLFCNIPNNKNYKDSIVLIITTIFKAIQNTIDQSDIKHVGANLFNCGYLERFTQEGESANNFNKLLFNLFNFISRNTKQESLFNESEDFIGNIYELLAHSEGKRIQNIGGEFYTSKSLCDLMSNILLQEHNDLKQQRNLKIYDPTCGSGGLLLELKNQIKKLNYGNVVKIQGQEVNPITYNLARFNLLIHRADLKVFDLFNGDTLFNPFENKKQEANCYDFVISNPPFSVGTNRNDFNNLINDERFKPCGTITNKQNLDLLFVLHSLHYLKHDGVACILLFPGCFFREGKERDIREYLINNNLIDLVIALPVKLFTYTEISTNLVVFKKNKNNNNVLFINAVGIKTKQGKLNILTSENIENILTLIKKRENSAICKVLTNEEIKANNYNLSIYSNREEEEKEEKEEKELIDIESIEREIQLLHKQNEENFNRFEELIKSLKDKNI